MQQLNIVWLSLVDCSIRRLQLERMNVGITDRIGMEEVCLIS